MTTTTPSSVITTTASAVLNRNIVMICGVVVAEKVLVLIPSEGLDSEASGETALQDIRDQAKALGADAIVDVKIKYKIISGVDGLMMVSVSGNAVKLKSLQLGVPNVRTI